MPERNTNAIEVSAMNSEALQIRIGEVYTSYLRNSPPRYLVCPGGCCCGIDSLGHGRLPVERYCKGFDNDGNPDYTSACLLVQHLKELRDIFLLKVYLFQLFTNDQLKQSSKL